MPQQTSSSWASRFFEVLRRRPLSQFIIAGTCLVGLVALIATLVARNTGSAKPANDAKAEAKGNCNAQGQGNSVNCVFGPSPTPSPSAGRGASVEASVIMGHDEAQQGDTFVFPGAIHLTRAQLTRLNGWMYNLADRHAYYRCARSEGGIDKRRLRLQTDSDRQP